MRSILPLLILSLFLPGPSWGQALDSLRARYRLPVPPAGAVAQSRRPMPAMGANSPTAFGASFGDAFVGAAYAARARNVDIVDGSVAAGVGLGDPRNWVGLEVDVISFSTFRSGWGERMGVDFIVHRILPRGFAVAAGWESALERGFTDGDRSRYLVLSKWMQLRPEESDRLSSIAVSFGVGDGRFRAYDDWKQDINRINWFGSVALRIGEPVSVIADWTGQDLVLGMSWAPLDHIPLVITPGLADVTGAAGDGVRFVMGGSFSLQYDRLFRRGSNR